MSSFAITCVACLIVAFLLGSIPSGVVIGRLFFGVDPRSGGSGSIGATNSNRMLGAKGGVIVLLCDMLKGVVAVALARFAAGFVGAEGMQADLLIMGSVFVVIAGHIYSPWLGFKDGKGIATGFGSLLVASPVIALCIALVFIVFAVATRIVSVGSIAAAVSVTVWCVVFHWGSIPFAVFGVLTSAMVVFAHRANIGRLVRGEEPKFALGKSPKESEECNE